MIKTAYSVVDTEELCMYAQCRDGRTDLEVELAQRLEIYMAHLAELQDTDGTHARERRQASH